MNIQNQFQRRLKTKKSSFKILMRQMKWNLCCRGQKFEKVGYGIFRVIEGKAVNLFGEGMEEC